MISNLGIRSNLIESLESPSEIKRNMDAPLARISAHDLYELCEIYRNWSPYFDKRIIDMGIDGLPTWEQKEQWKSYLFYGDKTVSMDRERYVQPWVDMADALLLDWIATPSNLESETGIEVLCLFEILKERLKSDPGIFAPESLKRLQQIAASIEGFLEDQCKISKEEQRDRVHQILGLAG